MTSVAVLIPVLGRPQRVKPLVESLAASSRFIQLDPAFLVSPHDQAELAAIEAVRAPLLETPGEPVPLVVDWEPEAGGDYARKINHGFQWARKGGYEFVFLAADDLVFHPGWIERALACHLETHACVVGTNDGGNHRVLAGEHSTHTLVHRDYADCGTVDDPDSGKILHEGYDHNFVDAELVETAKARETWAHASDSFVEHLHPLWRKAQRDATYDRGQRRFAADRLLYDARRGLWEAA